VKETTGGPRAYRRVGTADEKTTTGATITNDVAIAGSKWVGAATSAAPKLAALTQTAHV